MVTSLRHRAGHHSKQTLRTWARGALYTQPLTNWRLFTANEPPEFFLQIFILWFLFKYKKLNFLIQNVVTLYHGYVHMFF